jgi:hypothetical protein
MAEESGAEGSYSTTVTAATGGISTLIRHLLRKCHLPRGEGFINSHPQMLSSVIRNEILTGRDRTITAGRYQGVANASWKEILVRNYAVLFIHC